MELIKGNILKCGLGIDIGDGIMNFIIKKNSYIPCKEQLKLIKQYYNDYFIIKLYHGNNTLSKNNKYIDSFLIETNKLVFIKIDLLQCNYLILKIVYKNGNSISFLYKFNNEYIKTVEEINNFTNLKLLHLLDVNIKIAIKKLNNCKYPNEIKKKIISNLNDIKEKSVTFENQIIIEKINKIKQKFLL